MPATRTDAIDGLTTSVAVKAPCRVAANSNKVLSGLQTIGGGGGYTLLAGDRILLWGQTDQKENGVWEAAVGAWRRARDFDGARDFVLGTLVHVATDSASVFYKCTTNENPIILGTHNLTFIAIPIAGSTGLPIYNWRTLTANEAINTDDANLLLSGSSTDKTHAMPDPDDVAGQAFLFKNISAVQHTLTGQSFDGIANFPIQPAFIVKVESNGSAFYVTQNLAP